MNNNNNNKSDLEVGTHDTAPLVSVGRYSCRTV